jgi:hypothetical protein
MKLGYPVLLKLTPETVSSKKKVPVTFECFVAGAPAPPGVEWVKDVGSGIQDP